MAALAKSARKAVRDGQKTVTSMNVTLILAGLSGSIVKMRTPESSASYAMADHLRRVLPSSAISHRCRASSIELASRTEAIGKSC